MHPDQQYNVRTLQHADLVAEAERERLLRQAAPTLVDRLMQRRGLSAGAGVAAGIAVALLAVALPWGAQPNAQAQPRPVNRIFADEARYVPSIEEYLAVLPDAPVQVLAGTRSVGVAQPTAGLECQAALLPGIALCIPVEQGVRSLRQGGPR